MKAKYSRLIVVDASVAGAAGKTQHPVSSSCRRALDEILDICHRAIMTPAIWEEWKRHKTETASRWRSTMAAKKKIMYVREPSNLPMPNRQYLGLTPNEYTALEKDMPLIEGACAGDGIIITRDDAIIAIWAKCSKQIKTPKTIRWINPVREGADYLRNL